MCVWSITPGPCNFTYAAIFTRHDLTPTENSVTMRATPSADESPSASWTHYRVGNTHTQSACRITWPLTSLLNHKGDDTETDRPHQQQIVG